jgi:molybdopterin-guanine dinucleotide biosynthesis protein A
MSSPTHTGSSTHAGSHTHTVSPAPLYALILAGGASTRMQRDKAALPYQGKTQLDRAFELARRHLAKVFVSVRSSQITEPTRAHRPLIVDSVDGGGPIVGIRSALAAYPEAAWLVLACDLPFLTDAAIEQLIAERDPNVLATAYLSAHDGLPEPLCAIWEPAAAAAIGAYSEAAVSARANFCALIRRSSSNRATGARWTTSTLPKSTYSPKTRSLKACQLMAQAAKLMAQAVKHPAPLRRRTQLTRPAPCSSRPPVRFD